MAPPLVQTVGSSIKGMVQGSLRSIGFELQDLRPSSGATGGRAHEIIRPRATYAPWNDDQQFLETFQAVRQHTLVDVYRCYELWTLVQQCAKLAEGSMLEVGVWRGGTGVLMARRAALSGIAEPMFLADTFTGVVKAGPHDSQYVGGEHDNTSREVVEALVRDNLEQDNVRILQGIFPDDTAHVVQDQRFRLCHIDVDVYQSARDVLEWVWPRMVPGGMVVYDDYGFSYCDGVTRHVNERIDDGDCLYLYNLNGHGLLIKLPGGYSGGEPEGRRPLGTV